MSGVSGFSSIQPQTLPTVQQVGADRPGGEAKAHELSIPGPLPDTEGMSATDIYEVFADLVQKYGSEEARSDLAAGLDIKLDVLVDGKHVGTAWLEAESGTGIFLASSNSANSNSGSNDPTLFMSPIRDTGIDLPGKFSGRDLLPAHQALQLDQWLGGSPDPAPGNDPD